MEAKQGFILVICSMILVREVGKWWLLNLYINIIFEDRSKRRLVLAKIAIDLVCWLIGWLAQNTTPENWVIYDRSCNLNTSAFSSQIFLP